jgi:hypothetical protein
VTHDTAEGKLLQSFGLVCIVFIMGQSAFPISSQFMFLRRLLKQGKTG